MPNKKRLLTRVGLLLVILGIGLLSTVGRDHWKWVPRTWKSAFRSGDEKRVVYPYSVIPGGVYTSAELDRKLAGDGIAREHYRGFNSRAARKTKAEFARPVYLSYRRDNRIYWTRKPVRIPKGEILLTDGSAYVRARCGNRIAEAPLLPVEPLETAPPLSTFGEVEEAPPLVPLLPSIPLFPVPIGLGDDSIAPPFANPQSPVEEESNSGGRKFPVWPILVGIGAGGGTAVGIIESGGGGSPVATPPGSTTPTGPGGEPVPLPSKPIGPLRPPRFPVLASNPGAPTPPGSPTPGNPGSPTPTGGPTPGNPGSPTSPGGPTPGSPGSPSSPNGPTPGNPGSPSSPGTSNPGGSPVGSNPIGGEAPVYPTIPPNGGGGNPPVSSTPEPPTAIPIVAIGLAIVIIVKISRRRLAESLRR
jgi:hypothetical protein